MRDWTGTRILMIGGARQGLATARFLSRQGAIVTINDQHSADQMAAARQSLADLPVRWHLGSHPLTLLDAADLVCVSGGVPLSLPLIVEALRRGLTVTNDSQIFMEAVPCQVIGITGSAGKTTTTTLVRRMAQAAVQNTGTKAWVGGNIGLPLIDHLEEIGASDRVVLELSSFQLELMIRSPQVSAILNITPNHLDRHGSMQAYAAAKAHILTFQSQEDAAVLNREDAGSWNLAAQAPGKLVSFGLQRPAAGQAGTFVENGKVRLQTGQAEVELFPTGLIQLVGRHNLANVTAACAIAYAAGFPLGAMSAGVEGFTGVAHRSEWVRTWNGAQWINSSIDTAPERTMATIRSIEQPLVLLLGGRDKALPWDELAEMVHERVDHVVVFGEAAPKILQALGPVQTGRRPFTLDHCGGLQEAIAAAARVASAGDVVLLSPGGTSYDEFTDFEERGERFRQWVKQLS